MGSVLFAVGYGLNRAATVATCPAKELTKALILVGH